MNVLCKSVRRSCKGDIQGQIAVTEMMPDLDELWLTDAEDRRYTCELRMIAVDSLPPAG